MAAVIPTKGNLISTKRTLALARLGFDLMDRKRNILIREMMSLIDSATALQAQIDSTFSQAYRALQQANVTLGSCAVLAEGIPPDNSVQIRFRSVMGVEIPIVSMSTAVPAATYGFEFTNMAFDQAVMSFSQVRSLCGALAETETAVYRLAFAIKKTQKRANALQNIIIPDLTEKVKFITEALEEKEREEFVRLKVLKRRGE